MVSLVGRVDEVIHVAGRKVAPARIEQALMQHSALSECVVFGVASADPARVEEIVAVYAAEGEVSPVDLRSYLGRSLESWEVPRHWWRRPDLRVDRRGKISRARWKAEWLRLRAEGEGAGEVREGRRKE